MGGVKRDIHEKGRSYDEKYPYKKAGIERLMYDYWSIKDSQGIKGDVDSVALLADLERALDNCPLTPRMRQVLALKYFAGLGVSDVAHVIGASHPNISKINDVALLRVEAYMCSGAVCCVNAKNDGDVLEKNTLSDYVRQVGCGELSIYSRSSAVTLWLATHKKDEKAIEAIKQRRCPVKYVSTEEARPLTKRQMRYGDKRTVYVEDVYPKDDIAASRKTMVRTRDDKFGRDFKLENQKIFARTCCF